MSAGAKLKPVPPTHEVRPHPEPESEGGGAFTVSVRTRLGDDLEGLEAHGDGISFRSPRLLEGGQIIEVIICHAILVEAEVVGCAPLSDRARGYWVRARFHRTPPALTELICKELSRIVTAPR